MKLKNKNEIGQLFYSVTVIISEFKGNDGIKVVHICSTKLTQICVTIFTKNKTFEYITF